MNVDLPNTRLYITEFEASDIDGILAIEKTCFYHPWHRQAFEAELQTPNAGGYVVKIADSRNVSGYILFRIIIDEIHILKLATGLAWRNQSIASSLVKRVLETARTSRIKRIFLEVRATNKAAISVYKKNGFTVSGVRRNYYPPSDDALMMVTS